MNYTFALNGEHVLRESENNLPRTSFYSKVANARVRRRKLSNEDIHNLYCSPNIISDKIKDDETGDPKRSN
jgi:hypothetical protein